MPNEYAIGARQRMIDLQEQSRELRETARATVEHARAAIARAKALLDERNGQDLPVGRLQRVVVRDC